jgi:hypothetical protein
MFSIETTTHVFNSYKTIMLLLPSIKHIPRLNHLKRSVMNMNNIQQNLLFGTNIVKTFIKRQNNLLIRFPHAQITNYARAVWKDYEICCKEMLIQRR